MELNDRGDKGPDKGQWLTYRQRCNIVDERPEPPECRADAFPNSIRKAIEGLDMGEAMWMRALESEWTGLVGPEIARHTRPGRYLGSRLIVFVDSAVWMSELTRYRRDEMLQSMQQRFGRDRISSLSLQPDPEGGRQPRQGHS